MMLRLILMRHAKSSWDNLLLQDHERPLNNRGLQNCKDIAAELVKLGLVPDQVVASTAQRCVETWEHVGLTAGFDVPVEYDKKLYHSSAEQLLECLQMSNAQTLLMICHNPGIADFAARLVGDTKPDHADFGRYPTAAVCVISFEKDEFKTVGFGTGNCERFFTPKELGGN